MCKLLFKMAVAAATAAVKTAAIDQEESHLSVVYVNEIWQLHSGFYAF